MGLSLTGSSVNVPSVVAGLALTIAECVSVRSTSLNVIVPAAVSESVRLAVSGASSVTSPLSSAALIVTPSLVPWIKMVTSCVTLAPASSVTLTV
ncbi:hypothetical protein D3C83_50060 [compost metagenome]